MPNPAPNLARKRSQSSLPSIRFQNAINVLLGEKIQVRTKEDGVDVVVYRKREDELAAHILNLAMEQNPQRHMIPLHLTALNYLMNRLDPPTVPGAEAGGIVVNVTTNPQIMFADRVLQLAGDDPVRPETILEALERMPDDAPDDNGKPQAGPVQSA